MNIFRLFAHLLYPPWLVNYKFPLSTLEAIETSIKASESLHSAEIRFAVESSLDFFELFQNTPCFERGVDVFSELRIWDTESNNGILVFLLLADKKVEIIADRGFNGKVDRDEWQSVCHLMEQFFQIDNFEEGVIRGIDEITKKCIDQFPAHSSNPINELSNSPVIL